MDSVICSRRILVSDLPQMEAESLVDKLGFHFSKKVNGGGEVQSCWLDEDSGTAVIMFSEEGSEDVVEQRCSWAPLTPRGDVCVSPSVVDALVLKEFHHIAVHKATHTVRVAPFISGQMSRLEVSGSFLLPFSFECRISWVHVSFLLPAQDAGVFQDGAADRNPGRPGPGDPAGHPGRPLPEGQQRWRRNPAMSVQPAGSVHVGHLQQPELRLISISSAPLSRRRANEPNRVANKVKKMEMCVLILKLQFILHKITC